MSAGAAATAPRLLPITPTFARYTFETEGFTVVRNLLHAPGGRPSTNPERFAVFVPAGRVHFANISDLFVYASIGAATKAAPALGGAINAPTERVANVVLLPDMTAPPRVWRKLLAALRRLGTPIKVR